MSVKRKGIVGINRKRREAYIMERYEKMCRNKRNNREIGDE